MYDKPLPVIDRSNQAYWEGCRAGKILLPRCEDCGRTWFPPSGNCPGCLSRRVAWTPASGRGRVWSWNVFHRAYFPGFASEVPYLTALIELAEGPLMASTIVGAAPEDLRCDLPVEVTFDQVTDEITLPKFRIAR